MPKRFSTKNLQVIEEPTRDRPGVGVFEFTDDYSIFHYGKMPDRIAGKGEAICRMAVSNFALLEKHGIETHFRRFLPPDKIEFQLFRVLFPQHGEIAPGDRNYLIPLQVVFRNTLPRGASVFRRLERGQTTLEELGLEAMPTPGDALPAPLVEFTTKLEEIDRFIDPAEARSIAHLDGGQMQRVRELTVEIDELITRKAESFGLLHADGKVEFGLSQSGSIVMVDNAGTPDENRFLLDGFHIGKQVLRDYYAGIGLEARVQDWVAQGRPRSTWPTQEPLPASLLVPISDMYKALCELWTGETIWGAPSLEEVIATLQRLDLKSIA